jgi:S-adenosylmethionine/arginine decarboxylase-like enzyme
VRHIMLDAYGATEGRLNDVKFINNSLNSIAEKLGVVPVAPPFLLPYYYGVEPEDIGISSFLFLRGGHITIHTFPLRECYFVDMVFDGIYDEAKAYALFKKIFPFEETKSTYQIEDRDSAQTYERSFDPSEVFGPHIFAKLLTPKKPSMDEVFSFLEGLISKVGMTPIIRPYVITDSMRDPSYLSGIVMIAESHISFHYNYSTKAIYFDIFSCKMFDYSAIIPFLKETWGALSSYVVIARGSKHKFLKATRPNVRHASEKAIAYNSAWKDNILK